MVGGCDTWAEKPCQSASKVIHISIFERFESHGRDYFSASTSRAIVHAREVRVARNNASIGVTIPVAHGVASSISLAAPFLCLFSGVTAHAAQRCDCFPVSSASQAVTASESKRLKATFLFPPLPHKIHGFCGAPFAATVAIFWMGSSAEKPCQSASNVIHISIFRELCPHAFIIFLTRILHEFSPLYFPHRFSKNPF